MSMNTEKPNKNTSLPIKLLIGVIAFFLLGTLVYVVSNKNVVATLRSFAAFDCVNGATKREDGIWYDCKGGSWVPRSTTTTTTSGGTDSCPVAGKPCDFNGATKTCSGVSYCCGGTNIWTPCGSGSGSLPVGTTGGTTGSTTGGTSGNIPKVKNNTFDTGEKLCPPQQKKNTKTGGTKQTSAKDGKAACKDFNCSNIKQGDSYGIVNCNSGDPDGDMQLCKAKGRIGICQEKQLCCPGPGQQWTADMSACPVTKASISATQTTIGGKKALTVTYSGIPAPSTMDWIGMYAPGETDERNPADWNYTNSSGTCTKNTGDGAASGTCTFPINDSLATGTYELRLFSSDTFSKVAISSAIRIVGTVTPTPTDNPYATPTTTPTGTCCACPTPTPIYSQSTCNGACMTSANCQNGQICLLMSSYGWVCRNPACVETTSCGCTGVTSTPTTSITPTITQTPTPTPISYRTSNAGNGVCGEVCTSNTQCKTGYQCVYVNNQPVAICRNTKCLLSSNCICPRVIYTATPTKAPVGGAALYISPSPIATVTATPIATLSGTLTPTPTIRIELTPTPIPTPTPAIINPSLTVKPFTDKTGMTSQKFTITGTTDPSAEVSIKIEPDALSQSTTADAKGEWRYIMTKSLTNGTKELTVTATNPDGGETQVKQTFTVKASGSFFSLFLGFLLLAALGGAGFVIYQKQMNTQSNLFSQFPPISSSTEPTGTSGESQPQVFEESPLSSPDTSAQPEETDTNLPFVSTDTSTPSNTGDEQNGNDSGISNPPFST